ncbi:MAG: phosphoadenosine phosphosulfate reductase family protein [Methanomassiliicoccales archaeon]|nr:MAG: phosphoadenosine phosphosulfate reductase family protein [Methanomassiliicoccales archaeon]
MGIVRLGKMHLRWCKRCNVPILASEKCGNCGTSTVQVDMTPPGDARPAFQHDMELIRRVIDSQFGEGSGKVVVPEGKIVVLSKVPGLDRMDEVIIDGEVIGSLRYDLGKGWTFVCRMSAARKLQRVMRKGMVVADDGAIAPLLNNNNLMAPGVVDAYEGIRKGDEVIVVDKDLMAISTGTARMTTEEMLLRGKGVAVKTRWASEQKIDFPSPTGQTWNDVIKANATTMEEHISEAIRFMKETIAKNKVPAIVSFSGGKDSLACLLLAIDAGLRLPVLFLNTGLEFPETVEYVHMMKEKYDLDLIEEKAPKNAFFGNFDYFGPPGRDFRWCCKTNKLGPTVRAIMEHFPDGVLSFIGQRRYESEQRADKPRVWKNPWTPGQIGASPIQNWTSLHVWLYIFMKRAPYNPWYERGLDRIGCYLCPASNLAEIEMVLANEGPLRDWDSKLREYAKSHGISEGWVDLGLWRWRRVPPSILDELVKIGFSPDDLRQRKVLPAGDSVKKLRLRMEEGFSPCMLGFSIEGAFNRELDIERAANILNMVGKVEKNISEGWCTVCNITVFQEGAIIARGKEQETIKEKVETVRRVVVKAEECVGCGVCVARCKEGALVLVQDRISIDEARCIHCRRCIEPCPAISFGDTTFDF